jgi:hypothetical protein
MSNTYTEARSGISFSTTHPFGQHLAAICEQRRYDEKAWVADLKEHGVMAAHPDDGWVDRAENSVRFAYPYFDYGPRPDDFIALGWPDKWRLVRVTGVYQPRFRVFAATLGNRYLFEDVSR